MGSLMVVVVQSALHIFPVDHILTVCDTRNGCTKDDNVVQDVVSPLNFSRVFRSFFVVVFKLKSVVERKTLFTDFEICCGNDLIYCFSSS